MRGKKCSLALLVMLLFLGLTGCSKKGDADNLNQTNLTIEQGIAFSETGYFYSEDVAIEITCGKDGDIYYTTDGADPNKEQNLYKEPIKLIANKDTKANVIKAKAYYKDGTESETLVHSYFVGENVKERFNTLIFSVTTDPYNLYDYEYGIFVEGKLRDDYIAKNPGVQIDPDAPANYNVRGMEGERAVYLEVLESDGTQVIGQPAGIRTYGGWSRARAQKSIKIIARKEYDVNNKRLNYEFFPDCTSVSGEVLDSFKQVVLRNCGNDNGLAFIRDELFQTLAGRAGYLDYEAVRPAALFVNGAYRGFFWLHETYCDQYFEDHYGEHEGSFEIIEGGETFKDVDSKGENTKYVNEYQNMYLTYSSMDLTKEENFKKLTKLIDVENYLSYYALNIYLGNEDWPHNNYKTYRYYTAEKEAFGAAPFDGKWRYLPHDMDFSTGIYGTGADVDNIEYYIGNNCEIFDTCPLFGQLMQREDCKEIFITKTLDLLNGAFAPDYLSGVLEEMNSSRMNELTKMYGKDLLEDWVSYEQLPGNLWVLQKYAKQRASHILTKYQDYFSLSKIYKLTVEPPEGCRIKINSFSTNSIFKGSYYTDYDTKISISVPEGKELDYWSVNGNKTESVELIITEDMVHDGLVEVIPALR